MTLGVNEFFTMRFLLPTPTIPMVLHRQQGNLVSIFLVTANFLRIWNFNKKTLKAGIVQVNSLMITHSFYQLLIQKAIVGASVRQVAICHQVH